MDRIRIAIERIRSVGDQICSNQAYVFHDYNPWESDATAVCERLGIPYTDDIILEYPAKRTFVPMDRHLIEQQEAAIGVKLPYDYKELLALFGEFHLPGRATVCFDSPERALESTRCAWVYEGKTLSALAVSSYNNTSDGNSIGFVRSGGEFDQTLYEFDHELLYHGDDPNLWTVKVADSLSDFIIDYLK